MNHAKYFFAFLALCCFTETVTTARDSPVGTRIELSDAQIAEYDDTGAITLSEAQKDEIKKIAGFSPSRVHPRYETPDGETASGFNLALRTEDRFITVLHQYLLEDEKLAEIIQTRTNAPKKASAMRKASRPPVHPSYMVDSEGRIWEQVPKLDVSNPKNKDIHVYLHHPSSFPMPETVASRDTLRRMIRALEQQGIPYSSITISSLPEAYSGEIKD